MSKKPTAKQKNHISLIRDEKKKKEKLKKLQELDEEIAFISQDIGKIKKKLDHLAFEYEDLKNEMRKRNLSKFYTNLMSFAIIKFIN